MIHTFVPFAEDMDLGREYNRCMGMIGPDDWACFLDHDAIWTTREWYRQLREVTEFRPNAGMFTAVASRGWQRWQWHTEGDPDCHDMAVHRLIGKERLKVRTLLDVTDNSGIAGVVMLLSRSAWERAGGFPHGMYCVDHGMHFALAREGMRVYVVEGLYVYHWRRANGDAPPSDAPRAQDCPCTAIRRQEKEPRRRLRLP